MPASPVRILIRPGSVVTMDPSRRVLPGGALVVTGSSIESVLTAPELAALPPFDGTVFDAPALTAIPGFIQTHIHLCQTLFRGLADDLELLDWLRLKIYPYEAAHNAASMRASAMNGIAELIRSGTTTIMDMGSVENEEEIAAAVVGGTSFTGGIGNHWNDVVIPGFDFCVVENTLGKFGARVERLSKLPVNVQELVQVKP